MTFGFTMDAVRAIDGRQDTAARAYLGLALGFILLAFWGARTLRRHGRRLLRQSASEVRQSDDRPPVLFLRSFKDDRIALRRSRARFDFGLFNPGGYPDTVEELLLDHTSKYGPVVTMGNPADASPPVGVSGSYVNDRDRRSTVRTLMADSSLVVLGLETPDGTQWEVDTIVRDGHLAKTVFLFKPGTTAQDPAFKNLLDRLGIQSTSSQLERYPLALYADAPQPQVWVSKKTTEMAYEGAIQLSTRHARDAAARGAGSIAQ